MTTIPGADVLGFGFNASEEYDLSSCTEQIFKHKNLHERDWTFSATGMSYEVPDNIAVQIDTVTTGSAQVFYTRQQFQNYFSAKVGIEGKYKFFSGQFNFAYSQTFKSESSYYYGLYDATFRGWTMKLAEQTKEWLSDGFLEYVNSLPDSYTKENQEQFFALFRKFGTHVVTEITVGGQLYYYTAVEKSFTSDEKTIESDIKLEYKAVLLSAKAEAEVEWKQLSEKWAESRIVKVNAIGGDASILSSLVPAYGENEANAFATWKSAVMINPAITGFKLRPISVIVPASKATAISQAYDDYVNGVILVTANSDLTSQESSVDGNWTTSSLILVNNKTITPNPNIPKPASYVLPIGSSPGTIICPIAGFHVVLLNPKKFDVILSRIYYQNSSNEPISDEQEIYDWILNDVAQVKATDYILVLSGFAIDAANYPSPNFANWLTSCGIADGLNKWKNYIMTSGLTGQIAYCCIGQKGKIQGAIEEFKFSYIGAYPWQPPASLNASAVAFLYEKPQANNMQEILKAPEGYRAL